MVVKTNLNWVSLSTNILPGGGLRGLMSCATNEYIPEEGNGYRICCGQPKSRGETFLGHLILFLLWKEGPPTGSTVDHSSCHLLGFSCRKISALLALCCLMPGSFMQTPPGALGQGHWRLKTTTPIWPKSLSICQFPYPYTVPLFTSRINCVQQAICQCVSSPLWGLSCSNHTMIKILSILVVPICAQTVGQDRDWTKLCSRRWFFDPFDLGEMFVLKSVFHLRVNYRYHALDEDWKQQADLLKYVYVYMFMYSHPLNPWTSQQKGQENGGWPLCMSTADEQRGFFAKARCGRCEKFASGHSTRR